MCKRKPIAGNQRCVCVRFVFILPHQERADYLKAELGVFGRTKLFCFHKNGFKKTHHYWPRSRKGPLFGEWKQCTDRIWSVMGFLRAVEESCPQKSSAHRTWGRRWAPLVCSRFPHVSWQPHHHCRSFVKNFILYSPNTRVRIWKSADLEKGFSLVVSLDYRLISSDFCNM